MSLPSLLAPPDPARLAAVDALCALPHPYDVGPEQDRLFVAGMREIVAWHQEHSPFYAGLMARRSFSADHITDVASCAAIPAVHANFFKTHEVLSIPKDQVSTHLTSSGTTGQRSQMFFDDWSLGSAQRMVAFTFRHYGWETPEQPTNYLLLSYEPIAGMKIGTAFTKNFLLSFAPPERIAYALRATGHGHEFDPFGAIRALQEFADAGLPVRIFGFPAYLHFILERMAHMGLPPLTLPEGSLVFLGGGWKGHADKQIPKRDLYARITAQLGIPDDRCRESFGSTEHCVPYVECANHNFHVPAWSRVFVRDVRTLDVAADGETGFLHFVSPYITSVPAHSVLMGDLAEVGHGAACGCGLTTPTLRIAGRAGTSRNRTCSLAAAELLKRTAA